MDITLNNTEINHALEKYVSHQGINLDGKHVEVAFTAGRGANGNTAVVSIMSPEDAPKKARRSSKPEPVNLINVDQLELPFEQSIVSEADTATEEPSDNSSLFSKSS